MTDDKAHHEAVKLADLKIDADCQARDGTDPKTVELYAAMMVAHEQGQSADPKVKEKAEYIGCKLPAVTAARVDGTLYLLDGFHRYEAAKAVGLLFLRCEIIEAEDLEFARWLAPSQNRIHGLPRSNKDKRRAAELAVKNPIGQEQSTRILAEHVGVSHNLISEVRREREAEQTDTEPDASVIGLQPIIDASAQETPPADTVDPEADETPPPDTSPAKPSTLEEKTTIATLGESVRRVLDSAADSDAHVEHGDFTIYRPTGKRGVYVTWEDLFDAGDACEGLVRAGLHFRWDGEYGVFFVPEVQS